MAVYLDTTIKTNHLYYLCDFQYFFLQFGTSSKELYINSKTTSMSSLSSCHLLFPGTARQFIETRNKILPFHCVAILRNHRTFESIRSVPETLIAGQDRKGEAQIATCMCRWCRVTGSTCFLLSVIHVLDRHRWQTHRM